MSKADLNEAAARPLEQPVLDLAERISSRLSNARDLNEDELLRRLLRHLPTGIVARLLRVNPDEVVAGTFGIGIGDGVKEPLARLLTVVESVDDWDAVHPDGLHDSPLEIAVRVDRGINGELKDSEWPQLLRTQTVCLHRRDHDREGHRRTLLALLANELDWHAMPGVAGWGAYEATDKLIDRANEHWKTKCLTPGPNPPELEL